MLLSLIFIFIHKRWFWNLRSKVHIRRSFSVKFNKLSTDMLIFCNQDQSSKSPPTYCCHTGAKLYLAFLPFFSFHGFRLFQFIHWPLNATKNHLWVANCWFWVVKCRFWGTFLFENVFIFYCTGTRSATFRLRKIAFYAFSMLSFALRIWHFWCQNRQTKNTFW